MRESGNESRREPKRERKQFFSCLMEIKSFYSGLS